MSQLDDGTIAQVGHDNLKLQSVFDAPWTAGLIGSSRSLAVTARCDGYRGIISVIY